MRSCSHDFRARPIAQTGPDGYGLVLPHVVLHPQNCALRSVLPATPAPAPGAAVATPTSCTATALATAAVATTTLEAASIAEVASSRVSARSRLCTRNWRYRSAAFSLRLRIRRRVPGAALRTQQFGNLFRRHSRGSEAERGIGHRQNVFVLVDNHRQVRGHAGLKLELGVVDADDDAVSHHVLHCRRLKSNFIDLSRERSHSDRRPR